MCQFCIPTAEQNFKCSKFLGGLAASAPERLLRKVQNGCHDCISSGTSEEAGPCSCDADPAAFCSPTRTTVDRVTSRAHTGNPNLAFFPNLS